MPKQTVEILECDICSDKSDGKNSGWLEFDQDNPYLDRDWFHRCICPGCLEDIAAAKKRKKK